MSKTSLVIFLLLPVIVLIFLSNTVGAQTIFPSQSDFKYLKGKDAAGLSALWMKPRFDDGSWKKGVAPFWYGDGNGGTQLNDMPNNYSTVYLRDTFLFRNTGSIDKIIFNVNYDDGFIIWINGYKTLKVNAPVLPGYSSLATGHHESGSFEQFSLNLSDANLIDGTNYIAIQGFNIGLTSTDFHFDVQINATSSLPEYPGNSEVTFSEKSGFYSSQFNLQLTTSATDAKIVYTLDGSNPQNSTTAITSGSVANISINPDNTEGRARTPAVVLRASITKDGYKPGKPKSRTFIFLENVKMQSYPGGNWPAGSINGQTIDLDMDSRVVNSPEYSSSIDGAFIDIPSISIITDNSNLFNPTTGIYVNARQDGKEWERECSIELINPNEDEGFGVNAGIRIRGGFSRSPEFAKHSFRLFFREEYGDAKLDYPLFGDEGVDHFDKIDLRTAQNYAWSNGDSRNTMVKEVFSRDAQGEMGQPYTRSRYYHLYLNGMYWGLYQTQERSEANYAEDYFGGKSANYDVVKVEALIYDVVATDGNLSSWEKVYNKTKIGFVSNNNYFALEGKDENGNSVDGAEVLVDIDNLIDYMILVFYTGNGDGPVSEPLHNKQPNNFYGIYNREKQSPGFRFFCHDAEHALYNVNRNRVSLENRTNGFNMIVNEFKEFHPQWLHYKLKFNSEYRQRFSDRAHMFLTNGGVLTPQENVKRFNNRVSQIEMAIIAESARWGDARGNSKPFTKNDNWIPELNKMYDEYFPQRTSIVINQLKNAKLYSSINAPIVKRNGVTVNSHIVKFDNPMSVTLNKSNDVGVIYYSTDGVDPREIGGDISKSAKIDNNKPIEISSSTTLNSRVYYYGTWGALRQIKFIETTSDYSSLKVTELHYHPLDYIVGIDTTEGKKLEFIEFKNTGNESINLSGLVLDSAVYYEFPENEVLESGEFYVVSSKTDKFYEFYGMESSGNYKGYFSNGGEEVLLHDSNGNPVIHFTYDDKSPWPELPDGEGNSLVSEIRNPVGDPNQPEYWTSSVNISGSPFADEPYPSGNGLLTVNDTDALIYPNPTNDVLNITVSNDDFANEMEIEIYSITGNLLYKKQHSLQTSLSLQQLNLFPAFYIVKVSCTNFSKSYKICLTSR